MIEGVWVMSSVPSNVPRPAFNSADSEISFNRGGRFAAKNFPLVIDQTAKPVVRYVTESGKWRLVSNADGLGRAKITLSFDTSNFETSWSLEGSRDAPQLLGVTDIDYGLGFGFSRGKRTEP